LEFRKLGKLEVSAIGLGTMITFDVTEEKDIARRREVVNNCVSPL